MVQPLAESTGGEPRETDPDVDTEAKTSTGPGVKRKDTKERRLEEDWDSFEED